MPKKKFIDKKHATTFVLTPRSQRDPLISDENAPQNVLLPMDQVPSMAGGGGPAKHKDEKESHSKKKEDLLKYGIYFDDDYDYLQHIKDGTEVSNIEWDYCERIYAPEVIPADKDTPTKKEDLKDVKLKLPSSVFESEFKEKIGLLNKAATSRGPRPDLDPDVIAALDDDFDYKNPENELEDNFIELANPGAMTVLEGEPAPEDLEGLFSSDEEDDGMNTDSDDYEDERADKVGRLVSQPDCFLSDSDDESKSRFTSYSMSSSVVRRNKQLLLVDDCFEKMFENYDDTEIGALDCDEIEGDINPDSALLLKYAEEFEQDRKKEEFINEKITNLALRTGEESDSNDENMSDSDEDEKNREKWDCESILSTYSNTKNRPKVISEPSKRIRICGKTGIPVGVLGKGLTKHNLKLLNDTNAEANNMISSSRGKSLMTGATSVRSKTETTEERRERKNLVKEYRRERRLERKANTEAFKDEKKRLEKVRINDRHNIPGLKL